MANAANLKQLGGVWSPPQVRKGWRKTPSPVLDATEHDKTSPLQFMETRRSVRAYESPTDWDSQSRDSNRGLNVITMVTTEHVADNHWDNTITPCTAFNANFCHDLLGVVVSATRYRGPGKKQRIASNRAMNLKLKAEKREAELNRAPKEKVNRQIHRHSSSTTTVKICRGMSVGTDAYDAWEE